MNCLAEIVRELYNLERELTEESNKRQKDLYFPIRETASWTLLTSHMKPTGGMLSSRSGSAKSILPKRTTWLSLRVR